MQKLSEEMMVIVTFISRDKVINYISSVASMQLLFYSRFALFFLISSLASFNSLDFVFKIWEFFFLFSLHENSLFGQLNYNDLRDN